MHTHIDTHHLLDIEGASRHSVVPVPQLVVLGPNHQPSGGLVLSDIAGWKRRDIRQQKEEKTDLRGLEELPLSTCEPCHEGSMMMHTQSGWLTGGVGHVEKRQEIERREFLCRRDFSCGQDGMRWGDELIPPRSGSQGQRSQAHRKSRFHHTRHRRRSVHH